MVDFFPEPGEKSGVVSGGEIARDGRILVLGSVKKLGGIEIPEGIGREVAEQAKAPMDVLEATVGVVRD